MCFTYSILKGIYCSYEFRIKFEYTEMGSISYLKFVTFGAALLSSCKLGASFSIKYGLTTHFGLQRPSGYNLRKSTTALDQSALVLDQDQIKPGFSSDRFGTITDVNHDQVLSGLNKLYPPDDLNSRNSMSRKDGYWSFISTGEEPPIHLTYGEFDFSFFAELLERSNYHYSKYDNSNVDQSSGWKDKTFLDIGSGTGRLVIGAAALHPQWALCRGIEILPGIHETAVHSLEKCSHNCSDEKLEMPMQKVQSVSSYTNEQWRKLSMGVGNIHIDHGIGAEKSLEYKKQTATQSFSLSCQHVTLPLAPVEFSCGSFEDPQQEIGNADLIFVFSTCWTEELMTSLSECIRRECKTGTIAITTEFQLPFSSTIEDTLPNSLELVEKVDGVCSVTGGVSTAYIHRVV